MKTRNLIACALLLSSLISCAQGKYGVVQSYSYFYEFVPGTIAVDENGVQQRESDTIYSVFLETKADKNPLWKKAWANGKTYNVLTTVMATPYIVGSTNDTDEQVTLQAKPRNQLLQLNLEKTEAIPVPASYQDKVADGIILEGEYQEKKIHLLVSKPIHLQGKEYQ